MISNDLILLILVAVGAFYAGYQVGRLKVLAERGGGARPSEDDQPLPGPHVDRPYVEPPARPRAAPPPATAGNDDGGTYSEAGAGPAGRMPPRRSTKPPPASAGLMGTGEADKPDKRQK